MLASGLNGDTLRGSCLPSWGSFIRHPNGELVYANGEVKMFDYCELDIDHINIGNLIVLLNELGYKNHKAMHWYDKNASELETGINEIDGNQGIRELIEWLRVNEEPEFHIYIEHTIGKLILAEDVGVGEKVRAETVNLDEDSIHSWEMPNHVIHINSEDGVGATQSSRKRKENAEPEGKGKQKAAEPKGKGKEKVDEAKVVGKGKSPKKVIHAKKNRGGAEAKKRQDEGPSGLHGNGPEDSDGPGARPEDVGAGHDVLFCVIQT
ncbi:hypothetical protein PIB30_008926 [Stylosanthes scabra]|uniref:PB1-like domain-containing protein n=1 Tax=Stylosanthes scabra TaxID=79078 RepID=A0ABU6R3Y0_9FABA|nr:hypothetical protein [Stylosanthes scabra]